MCCLQTLSNKWHQKLLAKAIAFCPWVQKNSDKKPFSVSSIHPFIAPPPPPPPPPPPLAFKKRPTSEGTSSCQKGNS